MNLLLLGRSLFRFHFQNTAIITRSPDEVLEQDFPAWSKKTSGGEHYKFLRAGVGDLAAVGFYGRSNMQIIRDASLGKQFKDELFANRVIAAPAGRCAKN